MPYSSETAGYGMGFIYGAINLLEAVSGKISDVTPSPCPEFQHLPVC